MIRRNSTIAFHHDLMISFYAVTLQKKFLLTELKNLISLKRHTFYIKYYIHKTYLHKSFFFPSSFEFSSNKETKVLEKKLFQEVY